jgi:hypothetical protein
MALLNFNSFFSSAFINEASPHKSLGEEFPLCENRNMVFHWADYFQTCDTISAQMETDPELKADFLRREASLSRLSLIPVWIKTPSKIHQMTMFDLYERYLLNQSHMISGLDPFDRLDISFISGTGPFKSMAIAECFNKTTYNDFVLVNLLKGNLPRRDFRVRLKAKVLMEYGDDFENADLVHLEQLTGHGFLVSVDSELYTQKINKSSHVRMLIDTSVLKKAEGLSIQELGSHLSGYAFNLMYSSKKEDAIEFEIQKLAMQSSFEFLKTKKVYLFISFKSLVESHPSQIETIKNFMAYVKDTVVEHFQKGRDSGERIA